MNSTTGTRSIAIGAKFGGRTHESRHLLLLPGGQYT